MKVGVVGASGYAGVELLRLCAAHPDLEVVVATAGENAGNRVAHHTPSLAGAYPALEYAPTEASELDGLDVVFLALPHGRSQHLVPELLPTAGVIVDLAADFRLHDPGPLSRSGTTRATPPPSSWTSSSTGFPRCSGTSCAAPVSSPRRAAFPPRPSWPCGPLIRAGLIAGAGSSAPPLIVDAASGVSGAGRAASDRLHFGAVDEDFVAYGLLDHRHTPEMEQGLGRPRAVHAAPGPHGPGHPGHLLRAPGRPPGRLPGRSVRRHHRRRPGRPPRGL